MHLKGIKAYQSKGRVYYYHRATKTRIKAEVGTPEFVREVERLNKAAEKATTGPAAGTLGSLIVAYRSSPEWVEKAPATKADYQDIFDYLKPMADLPLVLIDGPFVVKLRDKAFAKRKRRFANYVVQVLSLLFNWGRPRGHTTTNPAKDVPKLRRPRGEVDANRPWTVEEFSIVMAALPVELRPALALGAYAGLREGDACALPWRAYDGTAIESRQGKTGMPIWVPAHRDLRAILDAERGRRGIGPGDRDTPILAGARGGPLTTAGFRARFFAVIREVTEEEWVRPGLTFHGLRHTAATLLAEAGCDTKDIMAITGHKTVAMAEHYARRANMKKRAAVAIGLMEQVDILPSAQVVSLQDEAAKRKPAKAEPAKKAPAAPRTGTSSPNAILTEADVLAIRASKESQRKLAQLYGVSRSLVEQIKSGKVWKHLLPAAAQRAPSGNHDEGSV